MDLATLLEAKEKFSDPSRPRDVFTQLAERACEQRSDEIERYLAATQDPAKVPTGQSAWEEPNRAALVSETGGLPTIRVTRSRPAYDEQLAPAYMSSAEPGMAEPSLYWSRPRRETHAGLLGTVSGVIGRANRALPGGLRVWTAGAAVVITAGVLAGNLGGDGSPGAAAPTTSSSSSAVGITPGSVTHYDFQNPAVALSHYEGDLTSRLRGHDPGFPEKLAGVVIPDTKLCATSVSAALYYSGLIPKNDYATLFQKDDLAKVTKLFAYLATSPNFKAVSVGSPLHPGDLVAFKWAGGTHLEHVEIYLGRIDGQDWFIGSNNENANGNLPQTISAGPVNSTWIAGVYRPTVKMPPTELKHGPNGVYLANLAGHVYTPGSNQA
jgi:hypothetical protein